MRILQGSSCCLIKNIPISKYSRSQINSLIENGRGRIGHNFYSAEVKDKEGSSKSSFNAIGIQMMSPNLHTQIFDEKPSHNTDKSLSKKIQDHLKSHGLWNKSTTILPDIDFNLPKLLGKNIDDHFRKLASQQSGAYRSHAETLAECTLPPFPDQWKYQTGWTKYSKNGEITRVEAPDDNALIFDVEVLVPEGNFPTMATAASADAWFSWCSDRLVQDQYRWEKKVNLRDLIPLEEGEQNKTKREWKEKLILGHNVGFDRSFVKEQYYIKGPKTKYLDTMSLHIAVSGLTSYQRILYMARKKGSQRKEMRELNEQSLIRGPPCFDWEKVSTLNNLNDVYQLHCKAEPLEKAKRDVFVTGCMEDVREQFQELMIYCANDVKATHQVFKAIWPSFCERFPHPVTFAGMLEMGSTYLPVNANWQRYIDQSSAEFDALQRELKLGLMQLANEACQMMDGEKYKDDPWLWDLDWSTRDLKMKTLPVKKKSKSVFEQKKSEDKEDPEETAEDRINQVLEIARNGPKRPPHMPGYPRWYTELCYKVNESDWEPGPAKISTLKRVAPKLLRLTWEGYPLHFDSTHGWGYIVPGRQDTGDKKENTVENFPIEAVEELCQETLKKEQQNQSAPQQRIEDELQALHDKLDSEGVDPKEKRELWGQIKMLEKNFKAEKWKRVSSKSKESGPSWHKGDGPYEINLPGCWFFKLPHKDGLGNRIGNPLAKDFISKVEDQVLVAMAGNQAEKVLKLSKMCSYWKNNADRIGSQMVVGLKKGDLPRNVVKSQEYNEDDFYGAIVTRVVSAGTVTRRAVERTWLTASNAYKDRVGSELKAMIQSPPGYHLVGADVDSQELWIAAILGDAHFAGIHGSTAFGWMTLQGKKSEGTDLHSKTASLVGISRDQAKIFNYGRIYGAGLVFVERLLMQFNHRLTLEEAKKKGRAMYMATKGKRVRRRKREDEEEDAPIVYGRWEGGSESHMFNKLEEIAQSQQPRTPVLDCMISRALEPERVKDNFITSRINWVVQSSAVDYLHLMLVCMKWLFEEFNIDGRFCISIHDEVRYLVKSEDRYRAALALQITNILTRSLFAHKLGMDDLPQSVAFFSAVDIDTCMRKEVALDCVTPSNPRGLERGYGVPYGEALDIYQILEKTNKSLQASKQPKILTKEQDELGKATSY